MKVKDFVLHSDFVVDEMVGFVPRWTMIASAHAFVLSRLRRVTARFRNDQPLPSERVLFCCIAAIKGVGKGEN